jgi:hypothetical protein
MSSGTEAKGERGETERPMFEVDRDVHVVSIGVREFDHDGRSM